MDRLQEYFNNSLRKTNTDFHRYMYDRINWNNRMIGLTGPRGVGKTTLILQYIKEWTTKQKLEDKLRRG